MKLLVIIKAFALVAIAAPNAVIEPATDLLNARTEWEARVRRGIGDSCTYYDDLNNKVIGLLTTKIKGKLTRRMKNIKGECWKKSDCEDLWGFHVNNKCPNGEP